MLTTTAIACAAVVASPPREPSPATLPRTLVTSWGRVTVALFADPQLCHRGTVLSAPGSRSS